MHNAWTMARALFLSLLLIALPAVADPAGDALALKVYQRPDGEDALSLVTMTLTQPGRPPRVRKMMIYRADRGNDETATLIRFLEPENIAGTGLLTVDHKAGESDQWIYLPAMERVRRIAASRKGGRFVNSEYYYEDLRRRHPSKDQHRVLGRETIDGVACDVLESTPVDPSGSVYVKRVSWVDRDTLLPLRVDFYEKNTEAPSKRLVVLKYRKIQGYWTVVDSTLTELASGNATRLTVEKIAYNRKLPARLFSTEALEDERLEEDFRPN